MKEARAALRYAKAILGLAIDNKSEAEVHKNMMLISSTIANSSDLQLMIKSPIIKVSEKIKALQAIFGDVDNITKGLFNLLKDNKRLSILNLIAQKYTILYNQYTDLRVAEVTTAVALTSELEVKIKAKIASLTNKDVEIKNIIDESIIGGFILKIGDKQFDASLLSKFNGLRASFDDNMYQAKI